MDCTLEQYLKTKDNYVLIDVRSPQEYKEGHIPYAVNVPLFSDEERAKVGTAYKQQGKKQAQWLGMEIVSPKIPNLLQQIKRIDEFGKTPLIYCFRGGLRSISVAQFCQLSGLSVLRLQGGYKAYRTYIADALEQLIPEKAFVLHGLTGTGKTEILKRLREKEMPVVDLEEIAGHRGSLFGHMGLEVSSQRMFDAYLYETLVSIQPHSYFIMEAESKRIGNSVLPERLLQVKKAGVPIIISCSFENRVKRIIEEYIIPYEQQDWFEETVEEILLRFWKYMRGQSIWKDVKESWQKKDYPKFVSMLLEQYYDPKYLHKQKDYRMEHGKVYTVDSTNIDEAVSAIQNIVSKTELNIS
ncbi:tRNA 2-selenouridine synthase [Bacillus oleivorans]|uniref:tRNA 2-selenouridine synthase n=1 Tax=Bacillus oleivorans TaxID=1448271 RepID=A0A285CLL2_9BACI|nr:tRNA 2-selenouridine(34) synthase MnmH [Bacillus oleivorans]SNX68427.1 tRNA 2-selenouridine synthase [Bacillus oleivorans]